MFIVDRSRLHVSTLKGSSSGFIFETSLYFRYGCLISSLTRVIWIFFWVIVDAGDVYGILILGYLGMIPCSTQPRLKYTFAQLFKTLIRSFLYWLMQCAWLVSNRRPDDDPLRVETCCLLLSTINIDVFDVLIILFWLFKNNCFSRSNTYIRHKMRQVRILATK